LPPVHLWDCPASAAGGGFLARLRRGRPSGPGAPEPADLVEDRVAACDASFTHRETHAADLLAPNRAGRRQMKSASTAGPAMNRRSATPVSGLLWDRLTGPRP